MSKNRNLLQGFNCIAQANARILILGSMPGQVSLQKVQYYAHSRNSFWFIMGKLVGATAELPYEERLRLLQQKHIALWDVVHRCVRKGSLDANIEQQTVDTNDFQSLFDNCPNIHQVFFNGQKAAALYQRQVRPELKTLSPLNYHTLPSTSPAHASLNHEQKYQQWRCIKRYL